MYSLDGKLVLEAGETVLSKGHTCQFRDSVLKKLRSAAHKRFKVIVYQGCFKLRSTEDDENTPPKDTHILFYVGTAEPSAVINYVDGFLNGFGAGLQEAEAIIAGQMKETWVIDTGQGHSFWGPSLALRDAYRFKSKEEAEEAMLTLTLPVGAKVVSLLDAAIGRVGNL